jgi:hypothetical protein
VPDSLADDLRLQAELDALTGQLRDVVDAEVTSAHARTLAAPAAHVRVTFDR